MIPIFIQARLNSTRLPGKVLKTVNGKTLLGYLVERLRLCEVAGPLVIACPKPDAGVFGELADAVGFDGEENDVYSRFMSLLAHGSPYAKAPYFIRVCADSPLLDPKIVDLCATLLMHTNSPIVTNAMMRSYPQGQCVEGVGTWGFKNAYRMNGEPMSDDDKEHCGMPYLYRHNRPQVLNFVNEDRKDYSDIRMQVDTQEDFERVSSAIKSMTKPHTEYGWKECLALLS